MTRESALTSGPGGRILTNANVWSPDGNWIAFDTRSDAAGATFDGTHIRAVNATTGEIRTLYESANDARCGVVTWHPTEMRVAFILGPEHPTAEWGYGPSRRQGVMVAFDRPGVAVNLDARDLAPPFTPGALRGGSHVHVWHPSGERLSFTYDDEVLSRFAEPDDGHDVNQRNVAVAVCGRPVSAPRTHPRNHDGSCFCVLVTRTTAHPRPGSDDIARACEEGSVGTRGYVRADGTRQAWAVAFQGTVTAADGRTVSEVFVADLPDDLTRLGDGPLEGSAFRRPAPPRGTAQRRLTFTADDPHPGLSGPRHWLRSSHDGSRIGYLRADENGVTQFWTVSPTGGPQVQVTRNPWPVASAFTWHPDGERVAFVMDNSVCITNVRTGTTTRLTERSDDESAPRPEACVLSPDGSRVAFVRRLPHGGNRYNQICVVDVP